MTGNGGAPRSGGPRLYRQVALLTSMGTSFAVTSAGGFVIGHWLDGKLGLRPWLTIVLGLMGVAGAFTNLIRTLNAVDRLAQAPDDPPAGPPSGSTSDPPDPQGSANHG